MMIKEFKNQLLIILQFNFYPFAKKVAARGKVKPPAKPFKLDSSALDAEILHDNRDMKKMCAIW